jgi:hypothetical protein
MPARRGALTTLHLNDRTLRPQSLAPASGSLVSGALPGEVVQTKSVASHFQGTLPATRLPTPDLSCNECLKAAAVH